MNILVLDRGLWVRGKLIDSKKMIAKLDSGERIPLNSKEWVEVREKPKPEKRKGKWENPKR